MRRRLSRLVFRLQCLLRWEEGQTMVEYALLASLITLGFVALFDNIGSGLIVVYSGVSTKIQTLVGGS